MSAERSKESGNTLRDIIVICSVLVMMTAIYLWWIDSPTPPEIQTSPNQVMSGDGESEVVHGMSQIEGLPESLDSLLAMGNAQMDARQYPMAAECYRRALILDSSMTAVRVDFGACLHGMGLAARAAEEFRRAIGEDPDHAVAHFNLGIAYLDLQRPDSSRVYFEKCLSLSPDGQLAENARKMLASLDKDIG